MKSAPMFTVYKDGKYLHDLKGWLGAKRRRWSVNFEGAMLFTKGIAKKVAEDVEGEPVRVANADAEGERARMGAKGKSK